MKSRKDGNLLMVILEDDEDLFTGLKGALRVNDVSSGIILTGIGMLKDFEIGYYNGKEYERRRIKEAHELVAMHGSIGTVGMEPSLHIHTALANERHEIIGGHLFGARVGAINEISILVPNNLKFTRSPDERTGLNLLDFTD